MWNYLYFRVHLNIKDSTEYTGPEQYIAEKVRARVCGRVCDALVSLVCRVVSCAHSWR
jgi:hypothetical protein